MKFLVLLFLISCTQFVQNTDEDYFKKFSTKNSNEVSLLFSGNINGETHPCGCRKFPRGGIPQVFAYMSLKAQKVPYIYVDAGDTFFPLPNVPEYILESSKFTAKKIAESLDKLKLKYLTPGDNDFALGEHFLNEITANKSFELLISNSTKKMSLKHTKLGHLQYNQTDFFFIGVLDPNLVDPQYKALLSSPEQAIKSQLQVIEKKYSSKNKFIILVSHSGLDTDKLLAKKFPELNWIIGAHSQSFLQQHKVVGQTSIGHVLNRNHFIGDITIDLTKRSSSYELIEMKEELQDELKNNPMISWLSQYKTEVESIQQKEQGNLTISENHQFLPTYISCSDCHSKQVDFWQQTPHSIAFQSLIKSNAAYNTNCIGCHSVGFKNNKGYLIPDKIILSENKDFNIKQYWEDFSKNIIPNSIRQQEKGKIKIAAKKWLKSDKEQNITHNFANVQCLNCHNQDNEHPFDTTESSSVNHEKSCTKCHTPDQSPEWYSKNGSSVATTLNKEYFAQKLKKVSCPKIERE